MFALGGIHWGLVIDIFAEMTDHHHVMGQGFTVIARLGTGALGTLELFTGECLLAHQPDGLPRPTIHTEVNFVFISGHGSSSPRIP